ncbi:hypothetical protein O2N63_14580 [Aliiroseovarius sp. KMU-50]|uniref:Secreted protein n=1 Tax=Aliiroseovarius salicola TaxID=3009082 RepID=A0ABT4W460_9RHOB|nr:hypothetical protein [Aliiroseovarius sp. KMU-50]MDA5095311.1 hypothetical protein [Aliiroseovarius sp. KMU-50]
MFTPIERSKYLKASLEGICFGVLCGTLAFTTQASAACYDTGSPAFTNSSRATVLCVEDACEDALLMRSCGNIHYASQDYDAGDIHWLFRVRFHQDGSEDDEFTIVRNGNEVLAADATKIRCASKPETGDCTFVDGILWQSLAQ